MLDNFVGVGPKNRLQEKKRKRKIVGGKKGRWREKFSGGVFSSRVTAKWLSLGSAFDSPGDPVK
jgi:hypothetical protein